MRYRSQLRFRRYLRRLRPTDTQPTLHSPRRNRIAPFLQVLCGGFSAAASYVEQHLSGVALFRDKHSRGGPHEQAYSSHGVGPAQRVTRCTVLALSPRQRGEM